MNRPEPAITGLARQRLRLWLRLLGATREIETELRERMRVEFDTTLPRFDVMAALARAPEGLKMSELSRALRVSNGNVTGIIDRLAADGMVARAAIDGDRRATLVRLTGAGRAEFERMAVAHAGWIDARLAALDAGDLRVMVEGFQRIRRTE